MIGLVGLVLASASALALATALASVSTLAFKVWLLLTKFSFGLQSLAFGFWLLAFGFWLLALLALFKGLPGYCITVIITCWLNYSLSCVLNKQNTVACSDSLDV